MVSGHITIFGAVPNGLNRLDLKNPLFSFRATPYIIISDAGIEISIPYIWVFPKIGVGPQNVWFIMENPINPWMIWVGFLPLFSDFHPYPPRGWLVHLVSDPIRRRAFGSFFRMRSCTETPELPQRTFGGPNKGVAAWCVRTVLLSNFQCLIILSSHLPYWIICYLTPSKGTRKLHWSWVSHYGSTGLVYLSTTLPWNLQQVRTWIWMVGIRSFPFGIDYFQVRTVSFRECIQGYSKSPTNTRYTTRFLLHLQYRTEVRKYF